MLYYNKSEFYSTIFLAWQKYCKYNLHMISIIIVHYYAEASLFACIESIIYSKPKNSFEIIVVDNNEEKNIEKRLKKRFPHVIYVPNENKGFGQGNNIGAAYAKGSHFLFLNPDTKVTKSSINELKNYLDQHSRVGIVAPFLYDASSKPYRQGTRVLTPLNAIFSFSFIQKLFPNNFISRRYWMSNIWDKKTQREVESVPGAAFMIRREIFEKIGGFDENFFLFFEDIDICKRVLELGKKIVMLPDVIVFHALGGSTKKRKEFSEKKFLQSRFYYFKKHFGFLSALITESFLRINKNTFLLIAILVSGLFLRVYRLEETMPFIGDQGWFYLSARDMALLGQIPLVGIPSSHPWLHQGPLWIYLLATWLPLYNFHPISGAYLSAIIDMFAMLFVYKVGAEIFSKKLGIIVVLLYAFSPLVVLSARMPYHTSPIPLFTILFIYFLYKWIRGNRYFFPLVLMTLSILYNFELATIVLWFLVAFLIAYGFVKRENWVTDIFQRKIIFLSLFAFLTPMIPIFIYDMFHGFPQTVQFVIWIGYKLMTLFGFQPIHPETHESFASMISFFLQQYTMLTFPQSGFIAIVIFLGSIYFLIHLVRKKPKKNIVLLSIINVMLLGGFFASRTPSNAYLPMLFPGLVIMTAVFFEQLMQFKFLKLLILIFFISLNCFFLIVHIDSEHKSVGNFAKRLSIVKEIVKQAKGKEYNLKGAGPGSQFESFTMNYEYLAWWVGHGPSKQKQKLLFVIEENNQGIKLTSQSQ